jgi:hypothetical protein
MTVLMPCVVYDCAIVFKTLSKVLLHAASFGAFRDNEMRGKIWNVFLKELGFLSQNVNSVGRCACAMKRTTTSEVEIRDTSIKLFSAQMMLFVPTEELQQRIREVSRNNIRNNHHAHQDISEFEPTFACGMYQMVPSSFD